MTLQLLRSTALCCLGLGSSVSGLEPIWSFRAPLGVVDSTPAAADIDRDGTQELVVTTTGGSVMVIDGEGRQVWMQGVQIPISIPPTVVDIVEGPELEVLVVNQSGSVYCLDGRAGDIIWRNDLLGPMEWGVSAIAAADLNGDGQTELICGDQQGHVVCISANGDLLWQFDGPQGSTFCPAIGPLSGENEPSILIAGAQVPLLCLDRSGKEKWRVEETGRGASPILADIDGDGQNEIITAVDNAVMAVDGSGNRLWIHPMKKEIDGSLCVADANEDGSMEIYAIDIAGHLAAIGPNGKELWTANVIERVRRSPAIGDVDGDQSVELLVAGYSGELYVFRGDGQLKESHPMASTTNASPVIADLVGDGIPTVIYAGGGGDVVAYRWPDAAPHAKVLWPQYRFDAARCGTESGRVRSPVQITAVDFGDLYVGANEVDVSIANPNRHDLTITITIDTGGAKPRTTRFERQERAPQVTARYTLTGVAPSTVSIGCSVFDGKQLVAERRHTAFVVPFKKELADLRGALEVTSRAARTLPDAFAMLGRVGVTRAKLPQYERQVAVAGTLDAVVRRELRDALHEELRTFKRLAALARFAKKQHQDGRSPLYLTAANPWAPFGHLDEILEGRTRFADLTTEGFSGETESAALNLFNLGTTSVTARVEIDDFVLHGESEAASVLAHKVVRLHEVLDVPTQTLDYSADALPRINQARTISLPAWGGRQLWLNLSTTHLRPGRWTSIARIRTLELEPREFTAPISLTVWEPSLPTKQSLRHCNWGYVHSSRHKHYEDQSLDDRSEHGNNVFVTGFVPRAKFDQHGDLVGEIDYAAHDTFVKKYAPHGLILFQMTGGISGPTGRDSDAFRKAYVQWMRQWVRHLNDMGIAYDRYAMYPVDEPGLRDGLVDLYLCFAKLTRQADPAVQMYTDPVHRITEQELQEMLPYVDIWCPNRIGFLLDVGAEKWEIIQRSGGQLWTYECEGNAKHQSPLGYYRGQSWLAWHHGLTGIGFWSYCTSSADPWFRPNNTQDYLLTYPGEGVVSSKRWEAVRDGIEDHAMLTVLRDTLQNTQPNEDNLDVIAHAKSLLGERATAIAQFCHKNTTPNKTGLPGVRILADARWAAIQAARRELAEALHQLTE